MPRRVSPRLASGDLIDVQGRPVRLSVNSRARRVSLRLDAARREVVAIAPSERALADAVHFAIRRADWIAAHLDRLPAASPFRPGAVVEILGQPCRLERAAMRIAPRLIHAKADEPARLVVYGDDEAYARACVRAFRIEARRVLVERTAIHTQSLGVPSPPVALMDARGRWGSCRQSYRGAPASIRYSWRLVFAPPPVLDYVAAHEVAHLVQANHGPRFWALVMELHGEVAPARAWLKANGARLHAMGQG